MAQLEFVEIRYNYYKHFRSARTPLAHVTVLGWERAMARDTGKAYESEWVHVFTAKGGKITRWRGFMDTAARFGV
ncbi:nuclear transport factor 2 family protein [Noviherbaspirillum pedocola]|uniref:SnoaL-like domain-containing protein n=1 Tax=Noviherbaspirillum pedocola TaxID=2801341 RepID=A0A934STB7_9BURK|nr:hypothetical protein [Noviherbaspirillum pedocola]MBK4735124.1 hypothetical protein [Noviherbaspirillum pedocola]